MAAGSERTVVPSVAVSQHATEFLSFHCTLAWARGRQMMTRSESFVLERQRDRGRKREREREREGGRGWRGSRNREMRRERGRRKHQNRPLHLFAAVAHIIILIRGTLRGRARQCSATEPQ